MVNVFEIQLDFVLIGLESFPKSVDILLCACICYDIYDIG